MSLLRLLQRLRNGRSGQHPGKRRGTPPAVEAALRAKRARAHLARKKGRGGRSPTPAAPLDLFENGAEDRDGDRTPTLDRSFAVHLSAIDRAATDRSAIDRSIPAGPLPPRRETPVEAARLPIDPPRRSAPRAAVPPARPLPRFVVPISTILALGLGLAAARPLFERVWLPRVPLARVAVVGTSVRGPESIAEALLDGAGTPLDRIDAERVSSLLTSDPWIESAESFRLPTGTLLVRVVERRAIARYQAEPEAEVTLLDPAGRPFKGAVDLGGALPLVEGPVDGEAALSRVTLEILEELRRHADFARDPNALTLHLPGSVAIEKGLEARPRRGAAPVGLGPAGMDDSGLGADRSAHAALAGRAEGESDRSADGESVAINDSLAGETGYVLEIGREGPRALLGQSFLKRRIARLAALLAQRDALVARARVIDLRFADRAVLRTEPTSG